MPLLDNTGKTNWKLLTLIAVLGIVAGAAIYFISIFSDQSSRIAPEQQQQEQEQEEPDEIDISDWQTYRNEEYGFEVKYPTSVMFPVRVEGDAVHEPGVPVPLSGVETNLSNTTFTFRWRAETETGIVFFQIWVQKRQKQLISLEEEIKEEIAEDDDTQLIKTVDIGGEKGLVVRELESVMSAIIYHTFFERGSNGFDLSIYGPVSEEEEVWLSESGFEEQQLQQFEQDLQNSRLILGYMEEKGNEILSTFRFID